MKLNLFFSILLSILLGVSTSFSSQIIEQLLSEDLKESKPFFMTGQEKLMLKLALLDFVENENVDLERVKTSIQNTLSQVKNTKKVFTSFLEYIEFEKAQWPESGDLKTDIERIKNRGLEIVNPEFQDEASQRLWEVNETNKKEFIEKTSLRLITVGALAIGQKESFGNENVSNLFEDFKERIVDSLRGMFAESGDGFVKQAFPILIAEYFEGSSIKMKANMMAGLLDETFPYSKEALINSLFSNSGPNLQKMVQLLGRDKSFDEKWKSFFQSFESGVRPVPFWQVEELIKKAQFPFEIVEFNPEPLGVGTIAQTHLGKVKLKSGEIVDRVFRFIKPGVSQRALEEKEVILNAARVMDSHPMLQNKNFPKLTNMADNVYTMIIDDMDIRKATKKQRTALEVYTRTDIYVPEIWLSLEKEPVFMIQSKAEGMKLSKYSLHVRKKVMNRIVQFWLEEAIYGSGNFHSDLHQGNFLVKLRKKFSGNERELKSILDYGMFGRLSSYDRVKLMGLFLSLKAKNAESITNISWELSNSQESQISKRELYKAIERKFGKTSDEEHSVEDMLKYFAEIKLELNQNVLEFLRGAVALSSQLKEVDGKSSLLANAVKVALKHPLQSLRVYGLKDISSKDIFKAAWNQFFLTKPKKKKTMKLPVKECLAYY